MSIMLPMRLDRVQTAFFEVLKDAFDDQTPEPTSGWAYGNQSYTQVSENGQIVLTMVSGPQPFIRQAKRGLPIKTLSKIPVTVDAAVDGQRYIVRLNGFDYLYDATGADTVTTIKDALVAAIEADEFETASATSTGVDSFDIDADFVGGIRRFSLVGEMTAGAFVEDGNTALVTTGSQVMLLNIQTYSKCHEPANGAWAMWSKVMAALQSEDYVEIFRRYGVGIGEKGVASDLSAVAGARWETRVSGDVTIYALAEWVRPIERIEKAEVGLRVTTPGGEVITSTATAP